MAACAGGGGGGPRPKGPNPGAEPPSLNPLNRPTGGRFVAEPGEYRVVLTVDGAEFAQTLTIEADPNVPRAAMSAEQRARGGPAARKALEAPAAVVGGLDPGGGPAAPSFTLRAPPASGPCWWSPY